MGRAAWGIDSPPRFEGWRPVEAAPRSRAAAGLGRCGGGAAGPQWWLELGETERGERAACCSPHLGLGWSEEVGPRRRVASSRGDRGGGAAGWEGRYCNTLI